MKCMCTVFAMFLIFISLMAPTVANEADWMPDANLRTVVRSALSMADDDALTQQAMQDLTSLTARNSQISNITGLEHATELTRLNVRDNAITDVTPLSTLTNLEALRLQGNTLSDISPLSGLTNLTLLNLRLTGISSVSALSGLTNLTLLRVDENSITDVEPLTSLRNLSKLWIAGNTLANAHLLSSLTNLTTLDITIPDPPDTTAPDVSISVPSEVQDGAFDVIITFTEAVSGFEQADLSLGGTATADITDWNTTDNTVFTATITPATSGEVTLDIDEDVATDAANNPNTVATQQMVTVELKDETAPTVSISVPSDTQNGAFDVTITFTEVVSGFEQADLSISGTATASVTAWNTTDDTVFTATITPTMNGNVILNIPVDVATDAAGNKNTAATPQKVVVELKDETAPAVSISVPSGTQNGAFDVTITFTEVVSGFVQADLLVSGTAAADITAWNMTDNTVYTATITPTTSGTVILDIPADVATDAAANGNTVAATQTVTVELDSSTVLIPDAKLAAAIRRQLELAADADITVADMQRLTDLSVSHLGISNLTGLEHATNLTTLNLHSNTISDISPLANLTNLTTLGLIANEISDISPLANLTNLTTLFLKYNQISDISPLANLTNLTELYISYNTISDLSALANLTNLTRLYLRNNPTGDISALANLTNLTALNLYNNTISDISVLANLTNLTELYINNNEISDISALAHLTKLTTLYLYANEISDISALANLTNLTTLFLKNNQILDTSPIYPLLVANGGVLRTIDIDVSQYPPWDVDEDGNVDATDSALVTAALGETGNGIANSRTDVNGDGTVDADDLTLVTDNLDTNAGAPSGDVLFTRIDRQTLESLDPETLQAQLDILQAKSDGSLKYLRAIALLETILEATRPKETILLANYPNPFNPETWIPYQLAAPSHVRITIYDARGTLVRQLDLGHQREGYYTSRSRAAYWDGRNDFGERVASGIYFYQFQADNRSLLGKMLILK